MLAERMKKWPERWEEKGRQEGRQETQRETALNLIRQGVLSDAQIAEATGLAEAEVQALRAGLKH